MPALLGSKGCCSHCRTAAEWWALKERRIQTGGPAPSHQPLLMDPEETQDEKAQGPEMRIRGMISVSSNSCTFPYVESPQFLSLRYLVFFNSNLLMFWLSDLCCKNSYISWLPPSLPPVPHHPCLFGTFSQSYLWAIVLILLPVKLNLQLSLCAFF